MSGVGLFRIGRGRVIGVESLGGNGRCDRAASPMLRQLRLLNFERNRALRMLTGNIFNKSPILIRVRASEFTLEGGRTREVFMRLMSGRSWRCYVDQWSGLQGGLFVWCAC